MNSSVRNLRVLFLIDRSIQIIGKLSSGYNRNTTCGKKLVERPKCSKINKILFFSCHSSYS